MKNALFEHWVTSALGLAVIALAIIYSKTGGDTTLVGALIVMGGGLIAGKDWNKG